MSDWWRSGVIYQVYPRSFYDCDGDGIGDLMGIYQKLPYLASLNIDAVWISPFFRSPMKDYGYDISDYKDVDPMFGSMDDFRMIIAKAHEVGIKIIIDLVLSHTSEEHPWFQESRENKSGPKSDWYIWADPKDDGTPPNNWLSIFGGGAWEWEPRRQQYYYHHFLSSQPDLNLWSEEVQNSLLDIMRFWLDLGVDGIRLDACNNYFQDAELRDNPANGTVAEGGGAWGGNPYSMQVHQYDKSQPENLKFIEKIRKLLDSYEGKMAVAEIGDDRQIEISAEYVANNQRLHTAYSFAFLGNDFSAEHIRNSVEKFDQQPGDGWPAWAFSNHDSVRACTRWGGENSHPEFPKMLLMLLCTLKGTVFLYQGEELALPEAEIPFEKMQDPYGIAFYPVFKGRDGARAPIPWVHDLENCGFSIAEPFLPVPSEYRELSVSVQEEDDGSMLKFTRNFLSWRKLHPAALLGDIFFLEQPEPILAYIRQYEEEKLLFVFNLSGKPVNFSLNKNIKITDEIRSLPFADNLSVLEGTDILLPAYGVRIAGVSINEEFSKVYSQ